MGKLEDIQGHLRSDQGCTYAEIKCQNFGIKVTQNRSDKSKRMQKIQCGKVMERRYLSDHHRNECRLRQYSCQYCGYTDTYDGIAGTGIVRNEDSKVAEGLNHNRICGHFPVECPNKCAEGTIKRKDMKNHRQTCPLEPLDCQFITVGCQSKTCRKDMNHHCQESMQAHLLIMVLKSNNKLVQQNVELVRRNQRLMEEMDDLESRIDDLEG